MCDSIIVTFSLGNSHRGPLEKINCQFPCSDCERSAVVVLGTIGRRFARPQCARIPYPIHRPDLLVSVPPHHRPYPTASWRFTLAKIRIHHRDLLGDRLHCSTDCGSVADIRSSGVRGHAMDCSGNGYGAGIWLTDCPGPVHMFCPANSLH